MDLIRLGFMDEPYLLVTFLIAVGVATALCTVHWRKTQARTTVLGKALQWMFIVSILGFAAVTISPSNSTGVARYCALGMPIPGKSLMSGSPARVLNTIICIPMGFFGAVSKVRGWARVGVAMLMPAGAEAVQWLVPSLGRSCSTTDLADNLTGVLIGIAAGVAVSLLLRTRRTATPAV